VPTGTSGAPAALQSRHDEFRRLFEAAIERADELFAAGEFRRADTLRLDATIRTPWASWPTRSGG
jgi:hypothetical protein